MEQPDLAYINSQLRTLLDTLHLDGGEVDDFHLRIEPFAASGWGDSPDLAGTDVHIRLRLKMDGPPSIGF